MHMSFTQPREIFLSIKPEFADLIVCQEKDYEFRRYRPKEPIHKLWFYVIHPRSELKYIAEVGNVIEYPCQIAETGVGNTDFNRGLKVSKFAFPILHLDEIVKGIPLATLREKFNFSPPQGYIYTDTFPALVDYAQHCGTRRLY